jgi:hypothetical protein
LPPGLPNMLVVADVSAYARHQQPEAGPGYRALRTEWSDRRPPGSGSGVVVVGVLPGARRNELLIRHDTESGR